MGGTKSVAPSHAVMPHYPSSSRCSPPPCWRRTQSGPLQEQCEETCFHGVLPANSAALGTSLALAQREMPALARHFAYSTGDQA